MFLKPKKQCLFREEATSALADFHVLSRSKWNLETLVFVKGGKPENPEKNPRSKERTNNKVNPHMAPGQNQTQATLVGSERSHHFTIPAPHADSNKGVLTQFLLA